ncbi:hypothetical protein BJ165DRAFT_111401 [Panaeolus papilionaceus]|nr:hypothetical protein BJ165DRAFT_111401 [Panaeolus papilionaceus]
MPRGLQRGSRGGRSQGMEQLHKQVLSMPTPIQGALVYVLEGLENPKKPTACAGTLFCCLFRVSTLIEEPNFSGTVSMSKIHMLWFCLYNFIIAKRTDEEFHAMVEKLSTCSCKMHRNARVFHMELDSLRDARRRRSSLDERRSETWKFAGLVCGLLANIMDVSKDRSVLRGVSKRWPPNTSELLPHGPDEVMKSLLQWHRIVGDCIVPNLFSAIIRLGGPQIYGSVAKVDGMKTLVIDPVRHQLNKTLDDMRSEPTARNPRPPANGFEVLGLQLRSCFEEVFRPPIRSNLQMLVGAETKALQLCSIFLYLLPVMARDLGSSGIGAFSIMFSIHGQNIFRAFGMDRPGRPKIPLHPLIVKHDAALCSEAKAMWETCKSERSETPIINLIASAMVECRNNRPCAAQGCHRTFRDSAAEFKLCSRCKTVGYCSKQCQSQHWNAEEIPHRHSCKIMLKISDARGGWHAPIPGVQESDDLVLRGYALQENLAEVMSRMRRENLLSYEELVAMINWTATVVTGINDKAYLDVEWHPGYDDYEEIIERISTFIGPKPAFIGCASA